MDKRIIMVAPNGARRTKADHPGLPITPAELAECAAQCRAGGANAFHLHVRGEGQEHRLDPWRYRAAINAIRARCPDLMIQCTTEAAGLFDTGQQFAMVRDLRPGWVSFSLTEMLRDGLPAAQGFVDWAAQERITIQFILYSPEDIRLFASLQAEGVLARRAQIILVAGRYGAASGECLAQFDALYAELAKTGLDQRSPWMTCAFGAQQQACLRRAMALGSHARVGFENAIVDETGAPLSDNAQSVAQLTCAARELGITPASAQDLAALPIWQT